MSISKSVIINCAGMGSRLGFGHTKALLNINGKPLVIHHLEKLTQFEDVRIVVGYKAKDLIDTVLKFRRNVIFVFNHAYLSTHTLTSLYLGSLHANKYIISLDGDLLIASKDIEAFLKMDDEVACYADKYSDDPVYTKIKKINNREHIEKFSRNKVSSYEWTGLLQIKKSKLTKKNGYVYELIENFMPFKAMKINCREIDTPNDFKNALEWAKIYLKK